jgi:hypothetical protein
MNINHGELANITRINDAVTKEHVNLAMRETGHRSPSSVPGIDTHSDVQMAKHIGGSARGYPGRDRGWPGDAGRSCEAEPHWAAADPCFMSLRG